MSIPFPHFFPQISKVHLSDDVCVSMENKRLQMIRKKKLPLNLSKKWNENIDEKKHIVNDLNKITVLLDYMLRMCHFKMGFLGSHDGKY